MESDNAFIAIIISQSGTLVRAFLFGNDSRAVNTIFYGYATNCLFSPYAGVVIIEGNVAEASELMNFLPSSRFSAINVRIADYIISALFSVI